MSEWRPSELNWVGLSMIHYVIFVGKKEMHLWNEQTQTSNSPDSVEVSSWRHSFENFLTNFYWLYKRSSPFLTSLVCNKIILFIPRQTILRFYNRHMSGCMFIRFVVNQTTLWVFCRRGCWFNTLHLNKASNGWCKGEKKLAAEYNENFSPRTEELY